ncbi:MAG: hypothetical protein FD180_583 [Planctomycetota bacterium]|nr:MAG: hypothetical protein FD180_583 [Planctomycetota bacterium]
MVFDGTISIDRVGDDGHGEGRMTFSRIDGKVRTSKAAIRIDLNTIQLKGYSLRCILTERGNFGLEYPLCPMGRIDLSENFRDLFMEFPKSPLSAGTSWTARRNGLTVALSLKSPGETVLAIEGAPDPAEIEVPSKAGGIRTASGAIHFRFDPDAGFLTSIEEDVSFESVKQPGPDEVVTKRVFRRTLNVERR